MSIAFEKGLVEYEKVHRPSSTSESHDPSSKLSSLQLGCKELCHGILNCSNGSILVRQDFVEECYQLVCSSNVNSSIRQVLGKIYDYIQWVQDIDKSLKNRNTPFNYSQVKWMHFQRPAFGVERNIGIGGMVANVRFAFLLSIFSGRFFLVDFWPQCNDTLFIWKPNAIPWQVTEELDRQLQIKTQKHKTLECKDAFTKETIILVNINHHIGFDKLDGYPGSLCISIVEEMWLFRQIPEKDDRTHVFITALLTHLLVDFTQADTLALKASTFKTKHSITSKYATMHVRTGLYTSGRKENDRRFTPKRESWNKQLHCALSYVENNAISLPIVLLTESKELKALANEQFGSAKFVTFNTETYHTQKDVVVKKDKQFKKCEEDIINTLVEIWMMTHSEVCLLARSTFSTLASNIGLIPYQKQSCCTNTKCYSYPHMRF